MQVEVSVREIGLVCAVDHERYWFVNKNFPQNVSHISVAILTSDTQQLAHFSLEATDLTSVGGHQDLLIEAPKIILCWKPFLASSTGGRESLCASNNSYATDH